MHGQYRKVLSIAGSLVLLGGVFFAGMFVGYENRPVVEKIQALTGTETQKPAPVNFDPFWKAWNVIDEKYVSENGPSTDDRVWGAISGLAQSLDDPYTVFLPPEDTELFREDISGEFEGVGMEIGIRDDVLTVIAPLKDTPAYRAGIKAGDKVIEIDEESTINMTIEEAVKHIRGPKGSVVTLTISREDTENPIQIDITRDTIAIPTVATEIRGQEKTAGAGSGDTSADVPEEVFVISLYNFSEQSPNLFRESLREFIGSGKSKLILDLRGNPGGYLQAAVDMASWFLPAGEVVVRESIGEGKEGRIYRSKGYNIFNDGLGMVVLVDQGSASASEILAGALSEHGVATVVGAQTFGKGSVQELVPITEDTALKITIARWLTPNGVSISKNGITPDVKVEITREDVEAMRDPQMEQAIEILTE